MDATTFSAISIAEYIALRMLDNSEIESIIRQDRNILSRSSQVMSRVRFVDELRFANQVESTDLVECIDRNSLETYLLCTCFDTLAGKADYIDLQDWLRTKRTRTFGVAERQKLIQLSEPALSYATFPSLLSEILDIYNKYYGTNKNILQLLYALPEGIKEELASAYTIYKESSPSSKNDWQEQNVNDKLKVIFRDYLFTFRRNLYTHESRSFPDFGGICVMRNALQKGNIDLPEPETHHFPSEKGDVVITCHYGDEALFLRQALFACLANRLGLLRSDWSSSYQSAERRKRLLYALLYEIKRNIQIMQYHLQVLSEPLILHHDKDVSFPKLETLVAQLLLDGSVSESLPIYKHTLRSYVQAALQFNADIDKTGAHTKYHTETTSQAANALMMKSEVRWYGQVLGRLCEQLLLSYPVWTYSTD